MTLSFTAPRRLPVSLKDQPQSHLDPAWLVGLRENLAERGAARYLRLAPLTRVLSCQLQAGLDCRPLLLF